MHIFKFEFTLMDTVFTAKFETKKVTGCSNKMLIRIVQVYVHTLQKNLLNKITFYIYTELMVTK